MLRSMATLNPRITVTLTPAVHAVLKELASLGGQSQSSIVGELLETSLPIFERVVVTLRAAKTIHASARAEVASSLERAQHRLEGQMDFLLDQMDRDNRPLLDAAEKVHRRGASGVAPGTREARPVAKPKAQKALSTPVRLTGGSGPRTQGKSKGKAGVRRGGV